MTKEEEFIYELEVFRTEIQSATQFFYAYLAIYSELGEKEEILDFINETPLFWKTNLGALQISFYITLGRIFDSTSKRNITKLLDFAEKNRNIFLKSALEARKRKGSANADEWIDDYLKSVHVPTGEDFTRLRKHKDKFVDLYKSKYKQIRSQVFAHKVLTDSSKITELFQNTTIGELQQMVMFLNKFYHALWELFYDGHKPILKPLPYSLRAMKKKHIPKGQSSTVQEKIIQETVTFLNKNTN